MPFTLIPPVDTRDDSLTRRLRGVASEIRRVTMIRGGSRMVALVVVVLGTLALLDQRYQLPALVRALGLITTIAGSILLARRWLVQPLVGTGDLVALALRVEKTFPEFNDSLVSAVQFQEMDADDRMCSPVLRRAAIRRAAKKADRFDFDQAVDGRWTKRWAAIAFILVAASAWLAAAHPEQARTAAKRMAMPFGGTTAPTRTHIALLAPTPLPHRMARGEALDIEVRLTGVISDRAVVSIRLDGAAASDQSYALATDDPASTALQTVLRVEPTRIPRDFQFRVKANDADTGWQSVRVLPPPVLVPLDGRPSPQLHLDFPAYTDLPAVDLPDGSGVIECVAGTRVRLRAAIDRPVARAWIGYRPDAASLAIAPRLTALGTTMPLSVVGFDLLGREVWEDVPVSIGRGGTVLETSFIPRLPGAYTLRFEDDTGLGTSRAFDVRVFPDPAPAVTLERPAAGRDSLMVLPDADVTFQARVNDKAFAIRHAWIEYRTGKTDAPRTFTLYEAAQAGSAIPALGGFMRGPIGIPIGPPLRLRLPEIGFAARLSLTQFRHPDGRPLRAGDVLTLQVAADDFDDVTGFKQPGRSHEVELLIVTRQDLEAIQQQGQSDLRAEIAQLQARQREARTNVRDALQKLQPNGKLGPDGADKVAQAEHLQQQIRTRIDNPDDGLRARLDRLKQSAKDNHLPRSAAADRHDDAAAELARLSADDLEPLAADLAAARPAADAKASPAAPLGRAEKKQTAIDQALQGLLDRLEPGSAVGEVRGEARAVFGELKRQIEAGEKLAAKLPPDAGTQDLTPEQKADLDRAAAAADKLAERGRQMVEKINRLGVEQGKAVQEKLDLAAKGDADAAAARAQAAKEGAETPARKDGSRRADDAADRAAQHRAAADDLSRETAALQAAAQAGNSEQLKEQLRRAAQLARQAQLGKAASERAAAADNLARMLEAMDDQKTADADRMAKKRADGGKELQEIIEEQERLQKKAVAARDIPDPEKRAAEWEKLARDEEKLERKTRDLAEKLTRNQGEKAGQNVRQAAREMARAREQMEAGDAAEEQTADALDRLDDAKDDIDQARQQAADDLGREQQEKLADLIRAIRDREQRLAEESVRIHAALRTAAKWERPLRASLNDLRQQQEALGGEARALVEKKFASAAVFGRMLRQSADAMALAAKRMDNRLDAAETRPFDLELEDIADRGIRSQQALALKRLDQLLDALKPDKPQEGAGKPPGGDKPPPDAGAPGGDPKKGDADALPPLAQLKALRSLQADISERTAAFDQDHPDREKLDDDEVAELESLETMQRDVAELIEQLTPTPAGDKP